MFAKSPCLSDAFQGSDRLEDPDTASAALGNGIRPRENAIQFRLETAPADCPLDPSIAPSIEGFLASFQACLQVYSPSIQLPMSKCDDKYISLGRQVVCLRSSLSIPIPTYEAGLQQISLDQFARIRHYRCQHATYVAFRTFALARWRGSSQQSRPWARYPRSQGQLQAGIRCWFGPTGWGICRQLVLSVRAGLRKSE